MSKVRDEAVSTPDREILEGNKQSNGMLDVLKLKLTGLSPEAIATKLEMRLGDVFKHDAAIKRSMKKEDEVELSKMDATQLAAVADTVHNLLPYMEKSVRNIAKTAKSVKPLYGDMVENAELLHALIHKGLVAEMGKDKVSVDKVGQLSNILNESYKAFFNKEGIQIVNVLNDNSVNVEAERRADSLKALKKMAGLDDVVDADIVEEK